MKLVSAKPLLLGKILITVFCVATTGMSPLAISSGVPDRTVAIKRSVLPSEAIEIVRVRGIDSENFLDDLGIEVKNAGSKPIYFLELAITRVEYHAANTGGLTLRFGPSRLSQIGSQVQASDESIKPGESVVVRPSADEIKGYKAAIEAGKWRADAFDTLFVWFQKLNYGDGTGYVLNHSIDRG